MMYFIQGVILLFSVIVHEVAHAAAARRLGDLTASQAGRLTLNPLVHIDVLGSIIVPAFLIFSGSSFLIGWAKPVPVSVQQLKHPSRDMMLIALAGPISNIVLVGFSILVIAALKGFYGILMVNYFLYAMMVSVQLNLILALFNLVPIPPLDGSRVLSYFLPPVCQYWMNKLESYGILLVFLLVYVGFFSILFDYFMPFVLLGISWII